MEKRKILALVGGIGSQSLNQKLFKVFQELAPPNFELQQFRIEKIPFLNVRTMGQPEFYLNSSESFDENGKLIKSDQQEFIQKYWGAFSKWIESNQTAAS